MGRRKQRLPPFRPVPRAVGRTDKPFPTNWARCFDRAWRFIPDASQQVLFDDLSLVLGQEQRTGFPVTHIRKSDIQFPDRQGISLHESLVLKAKVPRFQQFRRRRSIPASRHQDIESYVRISFRITWHLSQAEPSSAHDETASASCETVIAMAPVG